MDLNLSAYSTDQLETLLAAKLQKEQTETVKAVCDAIRSEIQSRKEKAK